MSIERNAPTTDGLLGKPKDRKARIIRNKQLAEICFHLNKIVEEPEPKKELLL